MSKKTIFIIFVVAFAVNLVWEALHYRLYIPLQPIVQMPGVTAGAALLDALWILGIFVFIKSSLKLRLVTAILLALLIEQWATLFDVWQYSEKMPIVPAVEVGLSPLLQLACTVLIVEFVLYATRERARVL